MKGDWVVLVAVVVVGVIAGLLVLNLASGDIEGPVVILAAIPWVTSLAALAFTYWRTRVVVQLGVKQLDALAKAETEAWINVRTEPRSQGMYYLVLRNERMVPAKNVAVNVVEPEKHAGPYKLHTNTDLVWPVEIGPRQEVWLLSTLAPTILTIEVEWKDQTTSKRTYRTSLGPRVLGA